MKFVVIGDMHNGVGADDPWHENVRSELMNDVYDYVKNNGIKQLLFLGDIFDNRNSLTHRSLEFNRKIIIDPIVELGLDADMIIGNHDAMHKNNLTPNAITEVFGAIDNFRIAEPFKTVTYDGVNIDLISWICRDNKYEIMEAVKASNSKYCFGHFELVGFYFYAGIPSHGDDPQFLRKYDYVGSGHFHTINSSGNVHYLGTPFTITANDNNEHRGFWVFDTEDMLNPLFVPNKKTWHRKINYPKDILDMTEEFDYEQFRDTRVVIDLNSKEDKNFEKLEMGLEAVVNRLHVNNNFTISKAREASRSVDPTKKQEGTVLDIAYEYIVGNDAISDSDKEDIKTKLSTLYQNAIRKILQEG